MIPKIIQFFKDNRFAVLSWIVTAALIAGMFGGALTWKQAHAAPTAAQAEPTAGPDQAPPVSALPALDTDLTLTALVRHIQLKTNMPADRPRYNVIEYTVSRGDSVFAIARSFDLEPESVLWANYDVLEDDPHSLKPGQELNIPPTNGIYYKWEQGDTIEAVAEEFEAKADDILSWPGNSMDLTNPQIEPGTYVMVPGGKREFKSLLLPTIERTSGSGTANTGANACGAGPVGSGFIWPSANHSVSGNDYWPGHLAIDIAAGEGDPVWAAAAGVVTMASSGWNYGYGNVVQIDHGNGYTTLYAHLLYPTVSFCQSVSAGQGIGAAGNTGNSFGAHLHFEIRQGGGNINPWYVLP